MDTMKSIHNHLNEITMRSKNTFSISFFVKKHRISHEKVPVYARLTVNGKSRDKTLLESQHYQQ